MNDSNLLAIAPILSLAILSLIVLLIEAFVKESEKASFWASAVGLIACGGVTVLTRKVNGTIFYHMLSVGGYGKFFSLIFILSALFTIILARSYLKKTHAQFGEFYLLVIFAALGMMLIAFAADLIIVFLGIELMSICLYVLAGFERGRKLSNESALKYFLLGAFATGFLLYGIALLYGASGTTNIAGILDKYDALQSSLLFWSGLGLLLVGFAFKVGSVPFHMWVPDVYQGSPTPVSGFMSTGAKAAAFSAFILVFLRQPQTSEQLRLAFSLLAAASMIVGNIVAISQTNVKRMLAYSSIAHAGYMLMGLAAGNGLGRNGIFFYLAAYMFMNIGAFGILSLFELEEEKGLLFEDYSGLGSKHPFLAAIMSIFMFSLAGIPPFAGFFGKYYIFAAAIDAQLTWLVILGVLTSVISVFYYLRLVMAMYFQDATSTSSITPTKASLVVLTLVTLAILQFGIFPSSLITIINSLY